MVSLAQVAEVVGATGQLRNVAPRHTGDLRPDYEFLALAPPELAGPDQLCFVRRSWHGALSPDVACIITESRVDMFPGLQLIVPELESVLPELLSVFMPKQTPWTSPEPSTVAEGVWRGAQVVVGPEAVVAEGCVLEPGAIVGPGAHLGRGVKLGARAVVEADAVVGEGCEIGSGAIIGWGCVLEPEVRVGRGTVIGAEGFGQCVRDGVPTSLPHVGRVVLERSVEVGAHCTIDRAMVGDTCVRQWARLDNQVHIAHNVQVGPGTMIAAQVGIAGSAKIGRAVQIGGQAGVRDHVTIGDQVKIAAKSGVVGNLKSRRVVAGMPAVDINVWRRAMVALEKLPKLITRWRLEEDVAEKEVP